MFYDKKSELWLPKPLRNQRGMVAPGIMPMIGPSGGLTPPLTGLLAWYKTPIVGRVDNDTLSNINHNPWPDSSGNNFNMRATSFGGSDNPAPVYRTTSVTINGFPVVKFDAANKDRLVSWSGDGSDADPFTVFNALTEASIYFVGRLNNDPPAGQASAGLWSVSKETSGFLTEFPGVLAANDILDGTFSTARRNAANLTPALATNFVYGVLSKANSWKSRFNGAEVFSTGTNTFATLETGGEDSILIIGQSWDGGFRFNYDGVIAEILIYDHFLDAGEITSLEADYLNAKYSLF